MNANLTLRIDRLILDGLHLQPGEEHRLRAAVEVELAHLLAEGGLPAVWHTGGAVPALAASGQVSSSSGPAGLGRHIAQSVYASLGGGQGDGAQGDGGQSDRSHGARGRDNRLGSHRGRANGGKRE